MPVLAQARFGEVDLGHGVGDAGAMYLIFIAFAIFTTTRAFKESQSKGWKSAGIFSAIGLGAILIPAAEMIIAFIALVLVLSYAWEMLKPRR